MYRFNKNTYQSFSGDKNFIYQCCSHYSCITCEKHVYYKYSVHPRLSAGGGGGASYQIFKKWGGGGLTGPQFREGVAEKVGVTFFRREFAILQKKIN